MLNNFLAEKLGLKAGAPFDMDTVTAQPRISLEKGDRVAIIVIMGTSTAAVTDFTLKQHDAASAGNTKDLATLNPYYKKASNATKFTKVVPDAETANFVPTDFAALAGIVVFEVLGEELDNENGYTHVSIAIADSTAAKLATVLYALNDTRYNPAYKLDL